MPTETDIRALKTACVEEMKRCLQEQKIRYPPDE